MHSTTLSYINPTWKAMPNRGGRYYPISEISSGLSTPTSYTHNYNTHNYKIQETIGPHRMCSRYKEGPLTAYSNGPEMDKHTIKTLNEQLINNIIYYRTALQLITGHIGLNKHLYNMNITNTTKCPACDYETETVTHFIGQCPAYSQIRADYFHTYYSNTDEIFDKQSLTRIVGFALKTKRWKRPVGRYIRY